MGIKVLVVDDSITARTILNNILKKYNFIESIETASDAYIARDKVVKFKPNVICLDVEMPRMNGITFLKKLMKYMPIPVIMVSSFTTKGAKTTLEALEAGALDFVAKPNSNTDKSKSEIEKDLIQKIKMASEYKHKSQKQIFNKDILSYKDLKTTSQKIVAIGSSTGGTEALKQILLKLPINSPPIIIVQHMPISFTKQFADTLDKICKVKVKETQNGDYIKNGHVFIAPGDKHMVLRTSGNKYYLEIGGGNKVSGHKPSIDVLFNSIAKVAAKNTVGVILTGMGNDGAKGLLNLKLKGAKTLGQDEKTCIVYGMPKVAFNLGAVNKQIPIENMASAIIKELETI